MNLYKIAVCIFFIQFYQLTIASPIIGLSKGLCLQQIRGIRIKPTGIQTKKNKAVTVLGNLTGQTVENNVSNRSNLMNFTDLEDFFIKSKNFSMSHYEKMKNLVANKTQDFTTKLTGNITENKVVTQAIPQAHQSPSDNILQIAKTDATQAASGIFNRNATTNHVTHITNNYYAPETLAQTLAQNPEKAKFLKIGAAAGSAGTTLFIAIVNILQNI